jgi:hypothetical protein
MSSWRILYGFEETGYKLQGAGFKDAEHIDLKF